MTAAGTCSIIALAVGMFALGLLVAKRPPPQAQRSMLPVTLCAKGYGASDIRQSTDAIAFRAASDFVLQFYASCSDKTPLPLALTGLETWELRK